MIRLIRTDKQVMLGIVVNGRNVCLSLCLRFNNHFSRWTRVSRYQNVSILDYIGAKDDGGGEW